MPDDHESALDLVGDIYDAALDPGLWPEVLHRISDFVGGPATAMVSHDVAARANRYHFIWGDNPDFTRSYQETYVGINPLVPNLMMLKPGEVWTVARIMPMHQFHQTRLYLEWVKPQGYGDLVGFLIERSGTVVTTMATTTDEARSPVSEQAKRRMSLIVPHVRRAVAIGDVIEMNRIEAASLGDAVDAMGAAVYLVRGNGAAVRVNDSGRVLVENGGLLRVADGRLVTVEDGSRRELARAISDAAGGDRAIGGRGTAIPLAGRDGERYVAHVLPLTGGQRCHAGASTGADAAVFVHRAAINVVFPIEAVARQFDLSKAELRVLAASMEVGPPAEVAPVLGVSEATVRTHLRRLFEKTGTNRQADLVKLVAGYANPMLAQGDRQPASGSA